MKTKRFLRQRATFIFAFSLSVAWPLTSSRLTAQSLEPSNPAHSLPELHQAIIADDKAHLLDLIRGGADVNQLDSVMGNAPLHIAAQCNNPEFVRLLIEHGAFVNLQTPRAGHTPLMVATWYSKIDNVAALLKAPDINVYARSAHGGAIARDMIGGWDKTPSPNDIERNDALEAIFAAHEAKLTAEMEAQSIYQVVIDPDLSEDGKEHQVAKLIANGEPVNTISPVTGTGNDQHSPLLVASRENYPGIVELLLSAGGDIGQRGYMMNAIPFHKAGYMGNPEVMKLLLQSEDAQRYIDDQGLNNGYTPLHDAIWHGHTEAARLLIQAGARLDLRTYEKDTPLDLAKRYQYTDMQGPITHGAKLKPMANRRPSN